VPERAKFYAGQLRWSNRSTGLEFAPLDSEKGCDTRRAPRQKFGTGETGMLLQDDLERDGYGEGHGVVVIALPRRMSDEEIHSARGRIELWVNRAADLDD
jgi:hypothetical protein